MQLPIEELGLAVRAQNCMNSEGIETIGELCKRTEAEVLKIRHFGKTSLKEIKKKLKELGLSLGMDMENIASAEGKK